MTGSTDSIVMENIRSADIKKLFVGFPMMACLLAYWEDRRHGRAMPDRADIDPLTIDRLILPHLILYDLFEGGRRAKVRLIGSQLASSLNITISTERFVGEFLKPAHLRYFTTIMVEMCEQKCPIYSIDQHASLERGHIHTHRLVLPLTHGSSDVVMSLGLTTFSSATDFLFPPFKLQALSESAGENPERTERYRCLIRDGLVTPVDLG